jgi:arsenate reductase
MAQRILNVLFLCTGNSARSVMAECALNRWGKGRFRAFSAGSHPKDAVHPLTLELLARLNYETTALRSKSWDEFARPGSPELDFVFTVCDNAAGEVCPVWPGQPITAHWGVRDPVAFEGAEEDKRRFFYRIYLELETRIRLFTSLPFDSLDRMALARQVAEIGKAGLQNGDDGKERKPR